ncbi:sulfatase-like hydrolase/transferase [Morganella morganii]|uniref:sulfatase-like hydrolase/transferase n=1 Tax=Morganella morganii TaxID=582 RepID=UPI001BD98B0F|nr:sulfatase-like hydrolase/transferase [Morganella morganii]MBT0383001.1 sulfatase-like hydrolase/transferase [Morganella morganii subsp. morganii]
MVGFSLLIVMFITLYMSKRMFLVKALILLLSMMLVSAWYIANDFTGKGMDDSFLYTITNSVTGTPIFDNLRYIVILALLFSLYCFFIFHLRKKKNKKLIYDIAFILSAVCFFIKSEPAVNIITLYESNNDFGEIEKDYIISNEIMNSTNGNYVFILAESLERTFKDIDGVNYLENISKIDNQIDFSNIGYVRGSGWTIAGHVNFMCGIPFIGTGNSASKIKTFLPKATCFTDIAKKSGYKNIYLSGTDISFAGMKTFLKSHSFDEIIDLPTLGDKYPDEIKRNSWGLDDKVIFDEAFDMFIDESKNKKPFMMYISTINTHSPGYKSYSCESHVADRYLDSVICEDIIISEFIKKIKESGYYDNTTIILLSDHGLMHWDKLINKDLKRTNLLTVFNKNITNDIISNEGTVLDQLPSALSAVSKKDESFGFGRSIYNKENSLKNLKNEYNMFSKSLWAHPSLNQKIKFNGKEKIEIGSMTFNLPICIYFDNKYEILDFGYEDGIKERCENDISKGVDEGIIIAEKCDNKLCTKVYNNHHKTEKIINAGETLVIE